MTPFSLKPAIPAATHTQAVRPGAICNRGRLERLAVTSVPGAIIDVRPNMYIGQPPG